MSSKRTHDAAGGWTAASVGLAVAVSTSAFLAFQTLLEPGVNGQFDWPVLLVSALAGTVLLAMRHAGTLLLALLLYFPGALFALYWLAFLIAVSRGDGP